MRRPTEQLLRVYIISKTFLYIKRLLCVLIKNFGTPAHHESNKNAVCRFFDSFARKIRIEDPASLICPVLPAKQIISHDHKRCRRNHKKKGCRQYQGPGHTETYAEQHKTA